MSDNVPENFTSNNGDFAVGDIVWNTELQKELDRSDLNTATKRSALPVGWATAVVAAIAYFTDWDVSVGDLLPYAPVAAIVYAAFYRALRLVERHAPNWLRYLIFGSAEEPMY